MTKDHVGLYYFEQANRLFEAGRLDDSLAILLKCIDVAPENQSFYSFRGLLYVIKTRYDKALADFTQAIALNPNDALPYAERGKVWAILNEHERAIEDFSSAIRRNPESANYLTRGDAYAALGRYHEALEDYGRAVGLGPDSQTYVSRGKAYIRLKEDDNAFRDLKNATLLDHFNTEAFALRAEIYRDRGDFQKAIDEYTQIVNLTSERADLDIEKLSFLDSGNRSNLYWIGSS